MRLAQSIIYIFFWLFSSDILCTHIDDNTAIIESIRKNTNPEEVGFTPQDNVTYTRALGTIVNSRWILSTATFTPDIINSSYVIINNKKIAITKAIFHPRYSQHKKKYNIALYELAEPSETSPATLGPFTDTNQAHYGVRGIFSQARFSAQCGLCHDERDIMSKKITNLSSVIKIKDFAEQQEKIHSKNMIFAISECPLIPYNQTKLQYNLFDSGGGVFDHHNNIVGIFSHYAQYSHDAYIPDIYEGFLSLKVLCFVPLTPEIIAWVESMMPL